MQFQTLTTVEKQFIFTYKRKNLLETKHQKMSLHLSQVEVKETETSLQFKAKIKKWDPQNCPCHLCKIYLQNVGFI